MKTVGPSPNHGEPDTVKVVRPVRREGRRNLPLKSGKALLPYSTAPRVIELALEMGHEEAAFWVYENRGLYSQGIFRGFAAAASPNKCGSSRHDAQHGTSGRTVDEPSGEVTLGDTCEGGENPCVDR